MKLSVMLFPFHGALSAGTLSAKTMLQTLADEGISAVEPMAGWVRAEPETWHRFSEAVYDAGMAYSCYDIGVDFIGSGPEAREAALAAVRHEIDYCRRGLSCSTVLLPGTCPAEGMSNEEGRVLYGEMLARAAAENAGSRVTITIEDFGIYPHFTASATHCLEVLQGAGDGVRFTFDNGNFLLGGDTPTAAYRATRQHIAHVHIKDFCRRPEDGDASLTSTRGVPYRECDIGSGDAQVRECITALRAGGYRDWVSLEVGGNDPLARAVRGARFIRKTWENAR